MKNRTPINEVNVTKQFIILNNANTLKEEGKEGLSGSQRISQYKRNFFGPSKGIYKKHNSQVKKVKSSESSSRARPVPT